MQSKWKAWRGSRRLFARFATGCNFLGEQSDHAPSANEGSLEREIGIAEKFRKFFGLFNCCALGGGSPHFERCLLVDRLQRLEPSAVYGDDCVAGSARSAEGFRIGLIVFSHATVDGDLPIADRVIDAVL